ncbi:hypothetical protein Glove_151g178 [Diversispora epigaea]|uniref:TLDc domain-containing protein n=1 Tax=Diversispora epigaea TaxID=1348612 RepID=A0A397IT35_9GLOM|nr:hypothetical protein Glove_151g178 [Diversispora epigaea]
MIGPTKKLLKTALELQLSSWINRKSTNSLSNIPYEFQLILQGSTDDFHPKTFWNICHGHAGTIVIAKVAGTYEIVGGYNPLTWDNSIEQLWDDIIQHSISPNEPITSLVLPTRIISNPELPSRTISSFELPSRVNEPFSTIINNEHVARTFVMD